MEKVQTIIQSTDKNLPNYYSKYQHWDELKYYSKLRQTIFLTKLLFKLPTISAKIYQIIIQSTDNLHKSLPICYSTFLPSTLRWIKFNWRVQNWSQNLPEVYSHNVIQNLLEVRSCPRSVPTMHYNVPKNSMFNQPCVTMSRSLFLPEVHSNNALQYPEACLPIRIVVFPMPSFAIWMYVCSCRYQRLFLQENPNE